MRVYLRNLIAGFVAVLLCVVALGMIYPAAVWGISRITPKSAEGNLVYQGECLVGSSQIQDGVEDGPYFFARAEGMSNYGTSSTELERAIRERREEIAQREGVSVEQVPADAVTGSGSGVDSGISPEYAELQAPRVAKERKLDQQKVEQLVAEATEGNYTGSADGAPVNVVKLNKALSEL